MSAASLLSAANLDHGAVGGGGNGKHARVGSLLAIHGGRDDGQQLLVRGTLPHGVTQTHLVGSEQTHLDDTSSVHQHLMEPARGRNSGARLHNML